MADFDSQQLLKFLAEKWANRPCPMCGKGPWNVQNKTFQLMEFHQGGVVIGGPVVPIVPVACSNCGNTVLVNAILAGVVKPDAPSPEPEKKP